MIHLDLGDAEALMLRETLESNLAKVRLEFGKTDSREWRQALKQKEEFLLKVIQELEHNMVEELDHARIGTV